MPSLFANPCQPKDQRQRLPRKEIGQGLVEFALAIPIFMFVVLGVIEFGYLMFTYSSVFSASREAARYGASIGEVAGVSHEKDCVGIRSAATRIGGLVGVTNPTVAIRYDKGPSDARTWDELPTCESAPDTVLGDRIIVRISFTFKSLVGVIPSMPITSSDSRSIIKSVDVAGDFPTPIPIVYTPTHTRTPTPTNTPTNTPTFTPTNTPTKTPTNTPTHTATHTPSHTPNLTPAAPTATPDCSQISLSTPVPDNTDADKYTFDIINASPNYTAKISSLYLKWELAGYPRNVILGGTSLWSGAGTSGNALTIGIAPNPWTTGANLNIVANETKPLTLEFSDVVKINKQNTWINIQLGELTCPSFQPFK